jgi:hypothetical protein
MELPVQITCRNMEPSGAATARIEAEAVKLDTFFDLYPGIDRNLVQTNNVSRMSDFSEVMTVRQLCDLVAFLETLHR